MTLAEIEDYACNQREIPKELTIDEQKFFVILRDIYYRYQNKLIDREQAVSEKKKAYSELQKQVDMNNLRANMFNRIQANLDRSEELRREINKTDDPARKLELALECIRCLTGDQMCGVES